MWVYRSHYERGGYVYTVGFFSPNGDWYPEKDFADKERAAARVHWLNGGSKE